MPADSKIRIPECAVRELDDVESMDWNGGLGLTDLIAWINQVAERFRPDSVNAHARSGTAFSPRSFRHYQTMGCVDAPRRAGKSVVYGFKHFVQGLVIRKLLWERMSSEQIAALMEGKEVPELKRLLLDGIEIVAAGRGGKADPPSTEGGTWKRIALAPGVELHLESSRPALNVEELETILQRARQVL